MDFNVNEFYKQAILIQQFCILSQLSFNHKPNKQCKKLSIIVFFGFQNPSPIEDDIGLVEIVHALGARFTNEMQLAWRSAFGQITQTMQARAATTFAMAKRRSRHSRPSCSLLTPSNASSYSSQQAIITSSR